MAGLVYKYADEKGVLPDLHKAMNDYLVHKGWTRTSTSALRTIAKQKIINADAFRKRKALGLKVSQLLTGAVYTTDSKGIKTCWASNYGCSDHNYGVALDMDGMNDKKIVTDKELAEFGLFRPMDHEPWHYELLKFKGASLEVKKVIYFQYTHGLVADGIAGPKTKAKMAEV